MHFCNICENIMYPKSHQQKLYYYCKTCQVAQDSKDILVEEHKLTSVENIKAKMPNKSIILDPTLPMDTSLKCPVCGNANPVYFQPSDESMTLIYACTNRSCVKMGTLQEFIKIDEMTD